MTNYPIEVLVVVQFASTSLVAGVAYAIYRRWELPFISLYSMLGLGLAPLFALGWWVLREDLLLFPVTMFLLVGIAAGVYVLKVVKRPLRRRTNPGFIRE